MANEAQGFGEGLLVHGQERVQVSSRMGFWGPVVLGPDRECLLGLGAYGAPGHS